MSVTISTQALGLQVSMVLQGWGVVCSNPRLGQAAPTQQGRAPSSGKQGRTSRPPRQSCPAGQVTSTRGHSCPEGGVSRGSSAALWWCRGQSQVPKSGLPAARLSPPCLPRQMPGAGSPTWGAKAEGVGRAEAAAAHPGGQGRVVLTGAGLVLAGRGHQADIRVQLHQEPALQQPHHHLDELRLQAGRPEVRGGARWGRSGPRSATCPAARTPFCPELTGPCCAASPTPWALWGPCPRPAP